jgi:Ca2+-binding RTX toxin-like protein
VTIDFEGNAADGNDTLQSSASISLAEKEIGGVETIQLLGSEDLEAEGWHGTQTIIGNAGNNLLINEVNSQDATLRGMGGDDIMTSGAGNDTLDGGSGSDLMTGSTGSDYYIVDNAGDIVVEDDANELDYDIIESSVSFELNDTITAGIEGMVLTGTSQLSATGNSLNNLIIANDAGNNLSGAGGDDQLVGGLGADVLTGGDGSDILEGGAGADQLFGGEGDDQLAGGEGNDQLQGGLGSDLYLQSGNFGTDTLSDAGGASDVLSFLDVNRDQLWFSRIGQNLEVQKIGSADKVIVQDWFSASDKLESIVSADGFNLNQSGVANLVQAMSAFNPQPLSGAPSSLQTTVQNAWTPIAA